MLFAASTNAEGVSLPTFTISASPSSLTIAPGNQDYSTITTTVVGGFYNQITLSASGLPSGTTANFSLDPIPAPGSGNSTMTISVGNSTTPGTYPITVTGTGGKLQQNTIVTLTVLATGGNFCDSGNTRPVREYQGDQGNAYVSTTVSGGFNSSIALSVTGLPSGTTASFQSESNSGTWWRLLHHDYHDRREHTAGNLPSHGYRQRRRDPALCPVRPGEWSRNRTSRFPPRLLRLRLRRATQGTSTISTTISGGFNSSIALSASGLPSGTTVDLQSKPNSRAGFRQLDDDHHGRHQHTNGHLSHHGDGQRRRHPAKHHGHPNRHSASAAQLHHFRLAFVADRAAGQSGGSTITTTISGGFNSSIALSAIRVPSGTTGQL